MKEQMKLLIGYDGSQCANAALDDLRRAGLPREAQAIVLTVFEQWLPQGSGNNMAQAALLKSAPAGSKLIRMSAMTSAEPRYRSRLMERYMRSVLSLEINRSLPKMKR